MTGGVASDGKTRRSRRNDFEYLPRRWSRAPSRRNTDDCRRGTANGGNGNDPAVVMLNMNRYTPDSGFPGRGAYHEYIIGLGPFLEGAGARLLWRFPLFGQAVGDQKIDEIIACWYPLPSRFPATIRSARSGREFPPKGRVRRIRRHPSMPRRPSALRALAYPSWSSRISAFRRCLGTVVTHGDRTSKLGAG